MTLISISIGFILPLTLLYSRKKEWYVIYLKKLIFTITFIVGFLGFMMSDLNEERMLYFGILNTPCYILVDSVFKYLSIKIHNRDFYLWLRGSDEIDDSSFFGFNSSKSFNTTDLIFSVILLFQIVGFMFLGVILFGHNNLYERLLN